MLLTFGSMIGESKSAWHTLVRALCAVAGVAEAANTPRASRPRLGGISFLHRFGSALNHHVHLHACVTDGVFSPNHPLRPAVTSTFFSFSDELHSIRRHLALFSRPRFVMATWKPARRFVKPM